MLDVDFADVKPSVINLFLVTLMAIVGITILKFVFTKYPVPGVSEVVMAV